MLFTVVIPKNLKNHQMHATAVNKKDIEAKTPVHTINVQTVTDAISDCDRKTS